ncbi:lantibiotic dehydratase [Chryseobacterium oranimense]|uniref:lantibiotic dehydratase n=1 Tax=Chryseobacterium oranimense TaxID=421058 RepID=UPI0021AE91F8|nr:lantibiotic dehydratase [Chryseobacterium oranimense]UWX60635.1 lantibiotic dehydratase [Chryseobacterium oranimense]
MRRPLFSLDFFKNIYLSGNAFAEVYKRLQEDELFIESIKMSSEEFYHLLQQYESKPSDKKKNIEFTFYKYFSRAANRTIPFGMFSGIGLISHSENNGNGTPVYKKQLLPKIDYEYLDRLIKEANENRIVREKLTYSLNNTIYSKESELIYIRKNFKSKIKNYLKTSIEHDEVMDSFLNFCRKEQSVAEIINFLKENFDAGEEEADEFFNELVDESIIFSDLNYSTIGKDFIKNSLLRNVLSEELSKDNPVLFQALNDIYELQTAGIVSNALASKIKYDLNFESTVQIDFDTISNVQEILFVYEKLSQNFNSKQTELDKFRYSFNKKYGEREILLLEALNIGYGTNGSYTSDVELSKLELLILKKTFEAAKNGKTEIEFAKDELSSFKHHIPDTSTKYCSYSLFKNPQHDEKKIINVNYVSFSSPVKILGRFTENQDISSFVEEISSYQNSISGSDFIFAEVDHLPTYLAGHIVKRNMKFDYIIRYPNDVAVEHDQKYIDVNDLYIQIIESKVYLRSKKLNKYVIPTFSTFFDHHHALNSSVFRFLLDVSTQYDNHENSSINVNNILNTLGFFPRISYKKHILKKAHWLIKTSDFFKNKNESISDALSIYHDNVKKLGLKKSFCIVDGEQELYINQDIQISVELFLKELKKKNTLIVCEAIYDDYQPFFTDEDQSSINLEIITPLKNKSSLTYTSRKLPETVHVLNKLYPFMHDCVYFKLFVNKDIANTIILDLVPFLKNMVDEGMISHFVFLYYYAPDFHIRFRVFSDQQLKFVDELNKVLSEKISYIDSLQYDTYDREILRYQGDHILSFEKIYYWDSLIACEIVKYALNSNMEDWLFCIKTALYYLDCFFSTIEDKINYLKKIKDSFGMELGITPENNKVINRIILENKNNIDLILSNDYPEIDDMLGKIRLEIETDLKNPDREDHTFDLIHMHIMRIVKMDNRFFEYIIYCIMEKNLKEKYYRYKKE